jgi:hypothetical protein
MERKATSSDTRDTVARSSCLRWTVLSVPVLSEPVLLVLLLFSKSGLPTKLKRLCRPEPEHI